MISAFHTNYADFRDLKYLHWTITGEEPAESVLFQLYDSPYNVSRQSGLEYTSRDVFGQNNMDDYRDPAKTLVKPSFYGHVLWSALQCSLW